MGAEPRHPPGLVRAGDAAFLPRQGHDRADIHPGGGSPRPGPRRTIAASEAVNRGWQGGGGAVARGGKLEGGRRCP